MSYTNSHDTEFFIEQEPSRKHFLKTLENLIAETKKNRASRRATLASKDIKLLRSTEAALVYLLSLYDNEWRICLPRTVVEYAMDMKMILDLNRINIDEDFQGDQHFLSICDVEQILVETNSVIHYVISEFDASMYRRKKSIFAKLRSEIFKAFPNLDRVGNHPALTVDAAE